MTETTRIERIRGTAVAVRGDDIDTDRIIPARFLRSLTFDELGPHAFHDARFDASGRPTRHPLNDPRHQGASILLVNGNFGCGSSREHAPQSLLRMGFRAVVGESFAEIFQGNCTAIGLVAATLPARIIELLMDLCEKEPGTVVEVDLAGAAVRARGVEHALSMPSAARGAFLEGTWDLTSVLLESVDDIRRVARELPYVRGFE